MLYTKIRDVKDPTGNRKEDAGFDFFVPNDFNNGQPYVLRMNEQVNIPSGIKTKFKNNQYIQMMNKSGVALKKGLVFGACVIDSGYRGEIHLNMFKVVKGTEDIRVRRKGFLGWLGFKEWATVINPGDKIIQGIMINISNESAKYISNKDVQNFDYTEGLYYPVVDEVDWNEYVRSMGGMVIEVEDKHHKIYRG